MRVLSINTYGGSLLLGAKAFGADIIGSYEDSGFGSGIQHANFPGLEFVDHITDWPEQNLSDVVVIAHPPCSAFSVQNSSWNARGENSSAFACTRRVLEYAMRNNAAAITVESVVGALGGAWYVHQAFADEHGYNLYRVLQNGCAFSAQWRERFWVVYVKKGLAPEAMSFKLVPQWQTVRDVITGHEGPSVIGLDEQLEKTKDKMLTAGMTRAQLRELFEPHDPPYAGGIAKVMKDLFFKEDDITDVQRIYLGNSFSSGQMCFLDEDKLAGVLLGSTWWYHNGHNLSETGYKRIMGFPADYIFPESPRNFRKQMRMYLSKGVIPAVATWVLGQIATHLGEKHRASCPCGACASGPTYNLTIKPNEIIDFRFHKKRWMKEELPELRHFEDNDEEEATA